MLIEGDQEFTSRARLRKSDRLELRAWVFDQLRAEYVVSVVRLVICRDQRRNASHLTKVSHSLSLRNW